MIDNGMNSMRYVLLVFSFGFIVGNMFLLLLWRNLPSHLIGPEKILTEFDSSTSNSYIMQLRTTSSSSGILDHTLPSTVSKYALSTTSSRRLEQLGELYYENQKKERGCDKGLEIVQLIPQFPCIYGVIPIGSHSIESVIDGHKFTCGLPFIQGAPIVYSFGSAKNQVFESSLLQLRPDAQIFVFEINPMLIPSDIDKISSIKYYNIGLGYDKTNDILSSLYDIMKFLGHTYIDILKMDIEGTEWEFLQQEGHILPNIGQFLVELHLHSRMIHFENRAKTFGSGKALDFLESIESQNLRLFFKEANTNNPIACYNPKYYTELSFIQKDWGMWNENKAYLKLK